MSTTAYAWAPITKSEKQDDGTLIVYGPAASSDLDRDRQRLNAEWLDRAMPQWMADSGGGAVREQHDPKRAVGVGVGLSKDASGAHLVTAKIVDPVAVMKIEHGVLKGFSVGIKNPKVVMGKADAPGGEIVDGDVIEVSVVDRPCNPTTLFSIAKADGAGALTADADAEVVENPDADAASAAAAHYGWTPQEFDAIPDYARSVLLGLANQPDAADAEDEETDPDGPDTAKGYSAGDRHQMASSGAATPDGSYQIKTKADLRKAIRAVGRGGKDHNTIRAHAAMRAKSLGLESMIPDNWNADGSLKDAAKAQALLEELRSLLPDLNKADGQDEADGEAGDITGAQEAIAIIARLITSEAEGLAGGDMGEAADIGLLLEAVRALKWFICSEQDENQEAQAMELAENTDPQAPEDTPDLAKQDTAASAEAPAEEFLTKAEAAEMVKAAVAEAASADSERIAALEAANQALAADVAKALAMPDIAGAPVLTRTSTQEAAARRGDADRLRAEAQELITKAGRVEDRDLRAGYLARASALQAKADA